MKIIKVIVPHNFNIFLFGDGHEGNLAKSHSGFDSLCHMMSSEYQGCSNNIGLDHGDIAETIDITDYRYDPDTVTSPIREQEDACVHERMSIARMLIAILDGNHTYKSWKQYGGKGGFVKKVCERLRGNGHSDVKYGSLTCKVHYYTKDGTLLFKSYHTHGRKTINSIAHDPIQRWANMKAILKRQLMDMSGDCLLMCKGHTHKLLTTKPQKQLYLVDNGQKEIAKYTHFVRRHEMGFIHPDYRFYTNTGSFLRLRAGDPNVSTYSERAEYPPIEIGFAVAMVRDGNIVGLIRQVV